MLKLIDNLKSRFPDGKIITSFSIFDPQNLPSPADLPMYGCTEIDTLADHYSVSKESDGLELEPLVDGDELKEEWVLFKQMISKNFKDSSIQGMAKKLLTSSEMQEQFPQTLRLLTLALTIPVSTVDCERGFSKQNLIKTKIRAKLKTENVSILMKKLTFIWHLKFGAHSRIVLFVEHNNFFKYYFCYMFVECFLIEWLLN